MLKNSLEELLSFLTFVVGVFWTNKFLWLIVVMFALWLVWFIATQS